MTGHRQRPSLAARQQAELESWRRLEGRREPERYFVGKLGLVPVLDDLLIRYRTVFEGARDVLELGAGTGWGSCGVKHRYPDARVTVTDFSPDALGQIPMWERVFDVRVDETRAVVSYDTGLPAASQDVVFAFASAHHFVLQRRSLVEMARILRPGGVGLYLYEPSCPDYLYPVASWRMRRTRSDVVEDTLRRGMIAALARHAGLEPEVDLYPSIFGKGPLGVAYNTTLKIVPPLRRALPCGANFKFTKPSAA